VFRATGVRLAELAGIRYDRDDPDRSDLDLERREIRVRGKGGKDRTVRIDHEAARLSTATSLAGVCHAVSSQARRPGGLAEGTAGDHQGGKRESSAGP
jgi:site-specific recombinase XerC